MNTLNASQNIIISTNTIEMNFCNEIIHLELGKEYVFCQFCNLRINFFNNYLIQDVEPCCINQDLFEFESKIICRSCGLIDKEIFQNEYIDFHENIYRIRKKSVYN